VDAACEAAIRIASSIEPNPAAVKKMNGRYAAYRALYPALRGISYAAE
jgi:sugar (pentulose or hexulose) kinase